MKNVQWIHKNTLHGAMAKWAVKQHPYNRPPRLFEACEDLVGLFGPDAAGMVKIDVRKFRRQVVDFCHSHPAVMAWNFPRKGRGVTVRFVSRYDRPNPAYEFIDLDALSGNIVREVGREAEIEWPERRSKCQATACSSTTTGSVPGQPTNG